MSKINFLKPNQSNLNTFLYLGTALFFISILNKIYKQTIYFFLLLEFLRSDDFGEITSNLLLNFFLNFLSAVIIFIRLIFLAKKFVIINKFFFVANLLKLLKVYWLIL